MKRMGTWAHSKISVNEITRVLSSDLIYNACLVECPPKALLIWSMQFQPISQAGSRCADKKWPHAAVLLRKFIII